MEIVVIALAIAAFLVVLVPASLLPLLAGAALGADRVDSSDRLVPAEPVGEPVRKTDERLAA